MRKSTLRRLPTTTRKMARMLDEIKSVERRLRHLLTDIEMLEHDSNVLYTINSSPKEIKSDKEEIFKDVKN